MYSNFKGLLDDVESGDETKIELHREDTRVVLGVLFCLVMQADGRIRKVEEDLYNSLLDTYLKITEDERLLFEKNVANRLEQTETVDQLTDCLKDMPSDKKSEVIDLMREISVSDRELHEVELALIERVQMMLEVD